MENEIRNTEKQIKKINEIENDAWFVRDLEFVVLKKKCPCSLQKRLVVKVLQPRYCSGSFLRYLHVVKISY